MLGFSDDNYESKGHIYSPYNTVKPHLYTGGVQGASDPLVGLVSHLKYIDLRQQCKATVLGFSDDNYESKGHMYGPYNTAKPHLYNGGVQGASGPLVGLVSHLKCIDLRQQC